MLNYIEISLLNNPEKTFKEVHKEMLSELGYEDDYIKVD